MRRISFKPYSHGKGEWSALHHPFGWIFFGLVLMISAVTVPKTIGVACDPSFIGIVERLNAETGLPWSWRSPSQRSAEDYRIVIRRSSIGSASGLVLGRVPVFPAVYRWNPVEMISPNQLARLKNGDIKRWSQLGGNDCTIRMSTGSSAVRRLIGDPWSLGWVYWPQLTPEIKILQVQGERFPWRGGPDPDSEFGWAVLEPPSSRENWPHFSRMIRDYVVRRAVRGRFNKGKWLYGGQRAVVTVVGDMLFDRGIKETAWDKFGDYAYVFGLTAHELRSTDLVMGNLECPLNLSGQPVNMFTGDPKAIPAIRYGGFDVLSLANNHALDCGTRGLTETIGLLAKNGVRVVGAGANREEARRIQWITIRGIRIAVLAYTEARLGFTYARLPLEWRAGENRPGVNSFDLQSIREDLSRARRMADIVIVLAHWGDEYRFVPNGFQRRMAKKMLEAGADLVVGHHPHVVQGIAFSGRGVVAYSLGNFVFDQYPRSCREGLILEVLADRNKLLQVGLKPVLIEAERPRILEGKAAGKLLRQLGMLSKELNKPFERGD